MAKKFLLIVILLMVLVFVNSCGEVGGTIIIENDTYNQRFVAVSNYSTSPGDAITKVLSPGEKYEYYLPREAKKYVQVYFTFEWRAKEVFITGGETVIIKVSDFL